jgi:serine/threonine protein kinase
VHQGEIEDRKMTSKMLNYRYRVIQELGEGGFGSTFLAEDTQMPSGRRCVIKQLKPVTYNPQIQQLVQQRFQREAAILEDLGRLSRRRTVLLSSRVGRRKNFKRKSRTRRKTERKCGQRYFEEYLASFELRPQQADRPSGYQTR